MDSITPADIYDFTDSASAPRSDDDSLTTIPQSLKDFKDIDGDFVHAIGNKDSLCSDQGPPGSTEGAPPLTKTRIIKGSNNDCILIPKHAINDDITMKFILHPNLPSTMTSDVSLNSNTNASPNKNGKPAGLKKQTKPEVGTFNSSLKAKTPAKAKTVKKNLNPISKSLGASINSTPSSGEQFVIKTAKEILYDIAQGRWNRQGLVYDEEAEGTRKFGSTKVCSNANCVRAAEKARRQRDRLAVEDLREKPTIFEDGNLPSYHSLLNLWKYQEEQKQRYTWLQEVFKHGFPQDETEFLKVWRECRKNPQAFGITISKPGELPDFNAEEGSRVRKVEKPCDRELLVAKFLEKQKPKPPIRLEGREYYSPEWKPVKDMREREKQKKRYEEFRRLYPHLPFLRDIDYRMNPNTVRLRMRQAEEWHQLVTASNKPLPVFVSSHYAADIQNRKRVTGNEYDSPPETAETSELDFSNCSRAQRYAASAASSFDETEQK